VTDVGHLWRKGRDRILRLSMCVPGTGILRKVYWDTRAVEMHQRWGTEKNDYPVLRRIIGAIKPKRLLDIGAGSGRLFDLYTEFEGMSVFAQEISRKAINLARARSSRLGLAVTYLQCELGKLDLRVDLIISNRALSAIPPGEIGGVVRHLLKMADCIYINELGEREHPPASSYWFAHDYDAILAADGFEKIEYGLIGEQGFSLWKRAGAAGVSTDPR
jgi:SAM-dependent methyltransferase